MIQFNVPATDIQKLKSFYSKIFGHLEFARSLGAHTTGYHLPISPDGLQLTITQRFSAQEPAVAYFSVGNLDDTIAALIKAGGSVMVQPFDLPLTPELLEKYTNEYKKHHKEKPSNSVGRSAVMRDPEGNLFGLTELHTQAHWIFKVGRYQKELDAAQKKQHARGFALGKELEALKKKR
jgi:predicted enzyme related to lactoylglutathione lyase